MCRKLMLVSCLVTLLGLSNIAFAQFEVFKMDFSCPDQPATKKGGDWIDFEVISGCDGQRHDPQWRNDVGGTTIDVGAGQPGGHGNVVSRSGDPICNTTYTHWEGACYDDNIWLAFRDLEPDTTYTVYTYHAWDDGDFNSVNPVTIEGADSCDVLTPPQVVITTSDVTVLGNPGVIEFTTDSGPNQVNIYFNGCIRFNAFELYSEVELPTASLPNPSNNEINVCPEGLQLSWRPGGDVNDANGHDVYFDTDYNDVRDANRDNTSGLLYYKLAQDSNKSPEDGDPLLDLELMTTYYWRVDEVNDPCIWTGSIWMFTTEDGIAYDFSPEDGIRGFNPSWPLTWTPSCSATGHKLYFGTDFPESIVLFEDGFEGGLGQWTNVGWLQHDASADANYAHSGTYSAKATGSGTLTSDDIDATDDANAIGVSFWVRTSEPMGGDELQLDYYNGSSYIPVSDFNIAELDASGQWVEFTDKITDSNYLISNFRIRLTANIGSGTVYVDDVNVSNAWPVDTFWLEAYLGGADNNYAPTLDPFTTYGWRLDTVIGSDVFQGEYGAFKTGLGGLLLEMLFDGGTPGNDLPATVTDTSGNALQFTRHTGTTGSAKYADGRYTGTSAVFDPCAGLYRQDTGDDDLLRLDGWQYTIEFWAYLPAAGYPEQAHHLMVGKQGGPWRIMISDPTDDDDIRWYHDGDNRTDAEGIITEIFDEWAHISAVFDKTAQLTQKLYIDGTVVASGSYQDMNPADNNNPMGIGVGVTNPPPFGFDNYFEGKIDELRIWDIALEPVLESATQPFPPHGSRAWDACDPNLDTFTWTPGAYAASSQGHKIYFGDSLDDVNESADPCATLDSNSWTHGRTFEIGTTYYWRVDEVNGPTTWTGPIWKFQTAVELFDANIVVYYPLDEISGKDVLDYSGRYFDAECDDNPHWEPDNGRYGGCMHFSMELEWDDDDGEWDWGDTEPGNIETQSDYGAQMADMINKQISISVWVNGDPNQRSESGEDMVVFEFCDEDYDDGINGAPDSTKVLAVVPTGPADRGDVVFRAGLYPEDTMTWRDFEPLAARDTWQHFVFIKNDANMYIYLNNELVATETDCDTTSLANVAGSGDATLKLGAYVDNSSDYHGRLDEFQIYNKALDEQEIEKIFRGGELEPAWSPSPYDGQGNVSYDTDLTWMPGDYVSDVNGHEVYFGTNYNEVFGANTTVPGPNVVHDTCSVTIFDPCLLELGQTYYWRVDEVNDPCVWKGDVWRFTVADYITIDDMEAYTQGAGSDYPIATTQHENYGWVCGYQYLENGTGSILDLVYPGSVYDIPAHAGGQAMSYLYDNSEGVYSEIWNHFELDPNDWTAAGVKMLTLWFYGDPENVSTGVEQMYVGLEDITGGTSYSEVRYGDGAGEDINDIAIAEWQEWNIALNQFTSVTPTSVERLYIGFGDREGSQSPGRYGYVYFDDIRLYPPRCVLSKRASAFAELDMDNDCSIGFGDIEIMAEEWLERDVNLGQVTAPPDGNLVGWWKFDDGSDSTAIDSSDYDNDGTLEILDVNVWWVTGRNDVNYALDFDGGRVRVPDVQELRTVDQVSVSAWIKPSSDLDEGARIVVKGADNKETFALELGGDARVGFLVRDGNDPNADSFPNYAAESPEEYAIDYGEWTHCAGTYDGNSVKCYVNGELVAENNDANAIAYFGHPLSQDTNDLAIGNRSEATDRPFKGIIDDVRVYDYGLSQAEVAWLASDGTGVVLVQSIANLINDEAAGNRAVNFRDFAVLGVEWLKEDLWP